MNFQSFGATVSEATFTDMSVGETLAPILGCLLLFAGTIACYILFWNGRSDLNRGIRTQQLIDCGVMIGMAICVGVSVYLIGIGVSGAQDDPSDENLQAAFPLVTDWDPSGGALPVCRASSGSNLVEYRASETNPTILPGLLSWEKTDDDCTVMLEASD